MGSPEIMKKLIYFDLIENKKYMLVEMSMKGTNLFPCDFFVLPRLLFVRKSSGIGIVDA